MKGLNTNETKTMANNGQYYRQIMDEEQFKKRTSVYYDKFKNYIDKQHNVIFNNFTSAFADRVNLQAIGDRVIKTFNFTMNDDAKIGKTNTEKLQEIQNHLYYLYCKIFMFN